MHFRVWMGVLGRAVESRYRTAVSICRQQVAQRFIMESVRSNENKFTKPGEGRVLWKYIRTCRSCLGGVAEAVYRARIFR